MLVILCLLLLVSAGSSNYMVVELQDNRIEHGVWSQLYEHPIKAKPNKTQMRRNQLKHCVVGQHTFCQCVSVIYSMILDFESKNLVENVCNCLISASLRL